MIVKVGETRQDILRSGTFSGVTYIPQLVATANNTRIAVSDFDAQHVSVRVLLKRSGKQHIIYQDNLKLLAAFCTLRKNFHEWRNGLDKVNPGAAVKHIQVRPVTINFGTHIRVNAGDELILETSLAVGTFGAAINANDSFIEFYANPSIGYEAGIPSITLEVVQQGTTKQSFNPGDNVTDLVVLNFDKDSLTDEVLTNVQLGTDRYDLGLSFNQVLAHSMAFVGYDPRSRYSDALPVTAAGQNVFRGLDYLPQSFIFFASDKGDQIDQVRLDLSFNGVNVAASQNYVGFRRVESSKEIVRAALNRGEKHFRENFNKLPEVV